MIGCWQQISAALNCRLNALHLYAPELILTSKSLQQMSESSLPPAAEAEEHDALQ